MTGIDTDDDPASTWDERDERWIERCGGGAGMIPKVPYQRLFLRLAPLTLATFLGGCDLAVLNPKGPVGDGNATILIDSVAIMLAIVVPTIVATLGIAWWFRSSNQRAFYLPDWEHSGQLELII